MTAAERATVSACIIARDEEERLPGALASLTFCDEVVVVDSGSRDRTVEVAHASGARTLANPWRGFGTQRNFAIDNARSEWILEVDADERVSPRLAAEIQAFLADVPAGVDICGIPCRDVFLGGRLGPSAKYPKYRLRLFRHGAYRHDEELTVHEGLWAQGRVWAFEGDLEHVLAATVEEAIRDAWRYARLEAARPRSPVSAGAYARGLILRPPAKFAYRLVIDGGWRDGWRGVGKIALDCAADAAVWVLLLGRRRRGDGASASGHYSQRRERGGPVRLLAIAAGDEGAVRAADWLRGAGAAGADVALVTDASARVDGDLHVRALSRLTPLRLIRALDAEAQLRGFDALVPYGRRERTLARLLPRALRAPYGALDPDTDPAEAERLVRAATR
jgi:glycosyltransferase involved in cell wall biosynthesis